MDKKLRIVSNFEVVSSYEDKEVKLPRRATEGSAGYDFYAIKDYVIAPNEIYLAPTGIKAKMNKNTVLKLYPRSSFGIKHSVILANTVGIIDSDYYNNKENEGHIMIALFNFGNNYFKVSKGDRIAQGIFSTYGIALNDDPIERERKGGMGSSDENNKKRKGSEQF